MFTTKAAADLRKEFEEGRSLISASLPSGIKITDHFINTKDHEIKVREYSPESIGNIYPAVVYFHGGGWVIGSIDSHEAVTGLLAKELKAKVFSVDYRLAPEHPFPIPLADCEAAYNWIKDNALDLGINPNRVSVLHGSFYFVMWHAPKYGVSNWLSKGYIGGVSRCLAPIHKSYR